MPDPIALAVPFFFLLIAIEYAWAKRRGVVVYRLTDSLTDLSCGVASQVFNIFGAAIQLGIYAWVFHHARLVTLSPPWWLQWLVAFVGVDLLYYWWHRFSHEVNFLWAAHVVHHQREDYNFAVALRQAVLTSWTVLPFYLPLAVVGVSPFVFAITVAFSTLYQFWIHTQLVGKLRGPVDWILNLPSHHRVHHAINPGYLDKNYGATLIIWDRLFGTYAEEVEAPVYGITKPLASFNPAWAQVHYWLEMGAMTRAARGPLEKLRVWVASPAWKPRGYVVDVPPVEARTKYDRPLSRPLLVYIVAQYAVVIGATFSMLMWGYALQRAHLVLGALAVLGALVAIGGLIEGRAWAKTAEVGRLALGGAALVLFLSSGGCRKDKKPVTTTTLEGASTVLPAPSNGSGPTRTSTHGLEVSGKKRSYLLVEPSPLAPGKLYPLVLAFHGDGGDANGFHEGFPFEKASGADAILAYPDGINATWDLDTKLDNREVSFIAALVDDLARRLPVDRKRVFAAGYSSGGFLANLIACQRSGLLRAISSSAGGAPFQQALVFANGYTKCPDQEPIAMLALHGEGDHSVKLDSGRFSAEYWAYVDGCKTDQMETTFYPECRAYRGCPAGKGVAFCRIPGLGHWVWDRAAEASWTFFRTQSND
ncbi:MAG TPA: sterol desaturase family protein [Labilithrix sp.]|nr:sterol desaturase family protein [Labilithrix sp.]